VVFPSLPILNRFGLSLVAADAATAVAELKLFRPAFVVCEGISRVGRSHASGMCVAAIGKTHLRASARTAFLPPPLLRGSFVVLKLMLWLPTASNAGELLLLLPLLLTVTMERRQLCDPGTPKASPSIA